MVPLSMCADRLLAAVPVGPHRPCARCDVPNGGPRSQHLLLAMAHAVRIAAHECRVAPAEELVNLVISRVSASRHLGMRVAVLTFLRTVLVLYPHVMSCNRLIKRVGQDWLGHVTAEVRALKARDCRPPLAGLSWAPADDDRHRAAQRAAATRVCGQHAAGCRGATDGAHVGHPESPGQRVRRNRLGSENRRSTKLNERASGRL